jgi:4-hydroxy-tetrahydrodipicolinate reductase
MRLGIFGKGKLAQAVMAAAGRGGAGGSDGRGPGRPEAIEVAWALGRDESVPEGEVDVVLDASVASAVKSHVDWALGQGIDIVIGATGWDLRILDGARAARGTLGSGILVAPNFSLGVAFARRAAVALGAFAALDPEADLAIVERHHRAKRDAPSGTARLLAEALAEGCPRYAEPGSPGVPVASVRAGSETGYHEMRCELPFETIVLSHEARSRELFARGALLALRWIPGRKGVYAFDELAAELIEPLFAITGKEGRQQC